MAFLVRILVVFLFVGMSQANAQWATRIDGPDVFGNMKVLANSGGIWNGIVVQCNQKDELILAFVFRKKEFEEWKPRPAEFFIQADSGTPKRFDASVQSWNDNFAGVLVYGRTPELVEVIRMIGAAQSKINIGWIVDGKQWSESVSSAGSTASW